MSTCKKCCGIGTASGHCDCLEPCPFCVDGETGYIMAGSSYEDGDCVILAEDESGVIVWEDIEEALIYAEDVAEDNGFVEYRVVSTIEWQYHQKAARNVIRYALGFKVKGDPQP